MTHPTPPKQYFITCDHSLVDTGRAPDDADGFFMFADEALAYANELAAAREKQARLDALEEAAHWIEHNEIWLPVSGGTPSVKPTTPQDVGANYRALAAEIRKLKEGI